MLRLSNITLARGARVLLKDASVTVFPGHRVGPRRRQRRGQVEPLRARPAASCTRTRARWSCPPRWVIAHVAQELDRRRARRARLRDGRRRGAARGRGRDPRGGEPPTRKASRPRCCTRATTRSAATRPRSRAQALMSGLGFGTEAEAAAVATFSGGWRMRLNLARALMCRSDLLLLDEPTNHLDLDAVLWLEDWLRALPGGAPAHHPRPRVPRRGRRTRSCTWTRRSSRPTPATTPPSSASAPSAWRSSRRRTRSSSATRAHLQAFIDRFRAKATKARQAQSRIKALEKLEDIAEAHVDSPFTFAFRDAAGEAEAALPRGRGATRATATRRCVSGVEWSVYFGEAIGLLGPNGAGKSTLLKTDRRRPGARVGEPSSARRTCASATSRSTRWRSCASRNRAMWHLARLAPGVREQELRDFLGGFDFRGDQVFQTVATSPAARRRASRSRSSSGSGPTCWCSTSRRTTSTSRCARRSRRRCRTSRARSSSSPTTGTCWRPPPTSGGWWPTAASRLSTATSTTTANGRSSTARAAAEAKEATGRRPQDAEAGRGRGAARRPRTRGSPSRSASSPSRRSSRPCRRSRRVARCVARERRGLRRGQSRVACGEVAPARRGGARFCRSSRRTGSGCSAEMEAEVNRARG